MKKNSMKVALKQSLAQEAEHVDQRFDVAEKLFSGNLKEPETFQKPIKKQKVIRDTFSMPSADYELIAAIKQRCLRLGIATTRSEIVRAGIKHLSEISESNLLELLARMVKLKTGRPKEYR